VGKRSLLLHACCAPCTIHVYQLLRKKYSLTVFYYNPNIAPLSEYRRRHNEIISLSQKNDIKLLTGDYEIRNWTSRVKKYRFLGEKSERCRECFRFRLEETFKAAARMKIEFVATTLSISPHKDSNAINRIGKELGKKFEISFYEADFKKNDGYKKSVHLSREHGFYRQNYCGCIYSKMERDKDSPWMKSRGDN